MDGETITQLYYLAPGNLKRLSIQKKSWTNVQPLHLETVEISPTMCCFEWEGEQQFQTGDRLDLHFALEDCSLSAGATILRVDKSKFLDEGYEHKTWFSYCARFDGELDPDVLKRIVGAPRKCKSSF